MFAHYYTNWMLLDAGPVLDPYMPFFPPIDPNAVTAVLLLFLFVFLQKRQGFFFF